VLTRLEALARGAPEDVLLQLLGRVPAWEARELLQRSNLPGDEAAQTLHDLIISGQVVWLAANPPERWETEWLAAARPVLLPG